MGRETAARSLGKCFRAGKTGCWGLRAHSATYSMYAQSLIPGEGDAFIE